MEYGAGGKVIVKVRVLLSINALTSGKRETIIVQWLCSLVGLKHLLVMQKIAGSNPVRVAMG